jgi:hypothetical protein
VVANPDQADLEGDFDGDDCDDDDDDDGVVDISDACALGDTGGSAGASTDLDTDGCQDAGEDDDDDGDGIADAGDRCGAGSLGWASSASTDHDADGCEDAGEDTDDDDDGVGDTADDCGTGSAAWSASSATDRDADGCEDAGEDTDDDDDGIPDRSDTCPYNDDPDCLYEGGGFTRTNVVVSGDAEPVVTGGSLMWQGCERGHSLYDCATGSAYLTDWYSQTTYCSDSSWAGYTDWRLPTITELESIVDTSVSVSPKINSSAFPNTTSGGDGAYASTVTSWNPVGRWFMQFSIGVSASAHYSNPRGVRCVRRL